MRNHMKKRMKKCISVLLTALMAGILLTGCGDKSPAQAGTEGAPQGQAEKGRYVEQEVALSGGIDGASISQIFRSGDSLHLLTRSDVDGTASLQEWKLDGDSFTEVTGEWLKKIAYPYNQYSVARLLEGSGGVQYLYAAYAGEGTEDYMGHLWKGGTDGSVEEITPESWGKPDEKYGYYDYPQDVVMLEDGILACMYYDRMEYYLAEDGSAAGEMPLAGSYSAPTALSGGNYGLAASDPSGGSMKAVGVEIFSAKSQDVVRTVPISQERDRSCYIASQPDDTLIIFNGDGIFRCKPDGDDWEKLIDGNDTTMALVNSGCVGFTALEDGTFYALFRGEGMDGSLMSYRYDPEATTEVTETLEVYSVYDSFLLQQAAALFHRRHPEVMVKIETAGTYAMYGEDLDFQQIYQSLNTKLLAGEGPDIIIMDGLNMESFESKGLLVDLGNVMNPLEEQGEVLKNITGSYVREDGSRYVAPLQFGMTLCVGRQVDMDSMKDIPSMAAVMAQTEESLMGPMTAAELVERFSPYFMEDIINGTELDKEALKENLEYLKAIGNNSGIILQRGEEEYPYNIWSLTYKAKVVFEETAGFNQAMLPISIANFAKGGYTPFENAYFPALQTGIYSKSEHQDTAMEFLAFMLSEEIQSHDYYEGFPVNTKALEQQKAADRSDAEAYTSIEVAEGMYEDFKIGVFPETDAEKLMTACRGLNKRAVKDDVVTRVIVESIPGYLDGAQTLDATADKIEAGLRMYLAE